MIGLTERKGELGGREEVEREEKFWLDRVIFYSLFFHVLCLSIELFYY